MNRREEKNLENTQKPRAKSAKSLKTGSSAWSGRTIFASNLEPIHTRLEPTPTGPRLILESKSFNASLPASLFILKLLARKLQTTATA